MTVDEIDEKVDSENNKILGMMTDTIKELQQALIVAFIQGAKWWEWHKEGATMWQSDQLLAEEEALKRERNKTLGRCPVID